MKSLQKLMLAGMMIAMLVAGGSASAKGLKMAPTFTKVEFGYFAGHSSESEGQDDATLTRKVNEYEGQF